MPRVQLLENVMTAIYARMPDEFDFDHHFPSPYNFLNHPCMVMIPTWETDAGLIHPSLVVHEGRYYDVYNPNSTHHHVTRSRPKAIQALLEGRI